ncbi:MAG: OmpA family protein [Proteobacteria bacterium]|nr:OmpA family protein [Pseudomonadota bacterium]
MLGRRWLEVVIQRYPETLAAMTARRELATLFPADANGDEPDERRDAARPASSDFASGAPEAFRGSAPRPNAASQKPLPESSTTATARRRLEDGRRREALLLDFQTAAGDRVFFGETNADLGTHARTVLRAQALWLTQHPELTVTVEAHADDLGTRDLDERLAERRGHAVRDRLVDEGLDPSRIKLRVYGRDRPVANCRSAECSAQNRRVVTRIGDETDTATDRRALDGPAYANAPRGAARFGFGD